MSMDRCHRCDTYVDTDDDPDCYQPDPRMSLKSYPDICICERCREREIDETNHANDMPPSL